MRTLFQGSARIVFACGLVAGTFSAQAGPNATDAERWVKEVTITRDNYGTPHVEGTTDAALCFGIAYAQCEDYYWQVEDNYLLAIGRYSEANGIKGFNSDLLNRAFEVVPTSIRDYPKLDSHSQAISEAFVSGINYYLARHPKVKPRLLTRYEPWMALAFNRHGIIEMNYRRANTSKKMPRFYEDIHTFGVGSNGWAVAGSRTQSGHPMILINPHQPWYLFGQMYEIHIKSGEGLNFTGATFYANPFPFLGHNEHLGWGETTNQPDVADAYRVTFDDPKNPLNYRYGAGYRAATEWKEPIKVKSASGVDTKVVTFRKTHHGPITFKENDKSYLAVKIAKLYDAFLPRQQLAMMKAKNLEEFKAAMNRLEFQYQNHLYADQKGNIYFLSNGTVPKRTIGPDYEKPVDGADPNLEWKGYHSIDELPQCLNPACGFVQNCNSSPFTCTDDGNPYLLDFPSYMTEGYGLIDNRRAKLARHHLRRMKGINFESMQEIALDTTMYWAMTEIPKFAAEFPALEASNPTLAENVRPYLKHLTDNWDYKAELDSTQATLAHAWYEELYGPGSPAERLKQPFMENPERRWQALVDAAQVLKSNYRDWKVKWGDVFRAQRHNEVVDFLAAPFSDRKPSVPMPGVPGPMGSIFTLHYTPRFNLGPLKKVTKRYGIVGNSYVSVVEFGPKIRAVSLIQFGQSADPASPHFMDQAVLLSQKKFKPAPFYPEEVAKVAQRRYHPGEELEGISSASGK